MLSFIVSFSHMLYTVALWVKLKTVINIYLCSQPTVCFLDFCKSSVSIFFQVFVCLFFCFFCFFLFFFLFVLFLGSFQVSFNKDVLKDFLKYLGFFNGFGLFFFRVLGFLGSFQGTSVVELQDVFTILEFAIMIFPFFLIVY